MCTLFCTLLQIVETMPHTENVEEFLEKLGDFYEMVDDVADKPVVQTKKGNGHLQGQRDTMVKMSDMTNGVTSRTYSTSGSGSSLQASDAVHSVSRLQSNSVSGL